MPCSINRRGRFRWSVSVRQRGRKSLCGKVRESKTDGVRGA
jgi:hypothetical protein